MNNRLAMFERYIHTNECSDEGGWFAYPCLNGNSNDSFDLMRANGLFINGCETEEQAVAELIALLVSPITERDLNAI